MTRVLLVEDSKINRELLKRRLDRRGFEVEVAEDGLRGFEMALALEPDVVLMDMSLPVLDGWRATARLRANAFEQPIIGLTAHALTSDRERALSAGCTDFITKPVDFEHLVASIARLTSSDRPATPPRLALAPTPNPPRERPPTALEIVSSGLCAAHAHDIGSVRSAVIALIDASGDNPQHLAAARDADAALEAMAIRWRGASVEFFEYSPMTVSLSAVAALVGARLGVPVDGEPLGFVRSDPEALATLISELSAIGKATRIKVALKDGVASLTVGPLKQAANLDTPTSELLTNRVLAEFSVASSPHVIVCRFASLSNKEKS